MSIRERVFQEIDRTQPDMYELLTRLVRIPTVQGQERPAQDLIAESFRGLGLELDVFEPDIDRIGKLPGFSPVDWTYENRPNVVGIGRGSGGGRSLNLNGHVDVVSPEPLSDWTGDPYSAEVRDGRMYGRGAGDMKAGLVQMIWAYQALRDAGVQLKGDVFLESVLEEECTGNGTLACRDRGYNADAAIITEPTCLGARWTVMGVMWFKVKVHGMSEHAARAWNGVNAIEKMLPMVSALKELEREKNQDIHPLYTDFPAPVTCNVGVIRAGDWASTVPGECLIEVRLGSFPGQPLGATREEVESTIHDVARSDDWLREHPPEIEYFGFQAEGAVFDRDSEISSVLEEVHRQLTGEEIRYLVATGTDDTRFFNLYYDVPATCYGPCGGGYHGADEYVELASIDRAAKGLAAVMLEWCGYDV